jgi:ATP-dependent protease ClpP protease subunit
MRLFLAIFLAACAPGVSAPDAGVTLTSSFQSAPDAGPSLSDVRWAIGECLTCIQERASSVAPRRVLVRLVGEIDSDAADQFERELAAAKGPVLVEIDGPGGNVSDGWRIMRAIERRGGVICVVDQEAASMDMLILESCAMRAMTRRSTLMAHEISTDGVFSGHPNDWQAASDRVRARNDAVIEQYVRDSKVTVDEMHRRTDGGRQWWIGWREALDRGFVDRVVSSVEEMK